MLLTKINLQTKRIHPSLRVGYGDMLQVTGYMDNHSGSTPSPPRVTEQWGKPPMIMSECCLRSKYSLGDQVKFILYSQEIDGCEAREARHHASTIKNRCPKGGMGHKWDVTQLFLL